MKIMKLTFPSLLSIFMITTSYSSIASSSTSLEGEDYSSKYKHYMLSLEKDTFQEDLEMESSVVEEDIRSVGIIGAGMAGLYSGLLIHEMNKTKQEGEKIKFKIFEVNDRVGGRIYTYRFNDDPDQYFEAGAMRIPKTHTEVFNLIAYVNKEIEEKYATNKKEKIDKYKINEIPYKLNHVNNLILANGKPPLTRKDSEHQYDHFDFRDTDERVFTDSPISLFDQAIEGPREELIGIFNGSDKEESERKFKNFLEKYDDHSMRSYLLYEKKWSHEKINYVEVMTAQTHQFNHSFVELLFETIDFSNTEWKTIDQGMSRLPEACAKIIGRSNILLKRKVDKLAHSDNGKVLIYHSGSDTPEEFDKVILAVPPSVVRMLDRNLWPEKEEAIRSMYFEPLYKIGLRFKTRFWENGNEPSFGGQSITDLPSRWIVYPSNGISDSENTSSTETTNNKPGVLLCYSWASDALKWLPLTAQEQEEGALRDLLKLHGEENEGKKEEIKKAFVESKSISWAKEWSLGDAKFLPGQLKKYRKKAVEPEENIFFAGEHLSLYHTWIRGALDSALTTINTMFKNKKMEALNAQISQTEKTLDKKNSRVSPSQKQRGSSSTNTMKKRKLLQQLDMNKKSKTK